MCYFSGLCINLCATRYTKKPITYTLYCMILLKSHKSMEQQHIQHCMLFQYDSGCTARAARNYSCSVYGEAVATRMVQKWVKWVREGNRSLDNEERTRRSTEVDANNLLTLIQEDPKLSTKELARQLNCNFFLVSRHLEKFGKTCRSGKWVPHKVSQANLSTQIGVYHFLLI